MHSRWAIPSRSADRRARATSSAIIGYKLRVTNRLTKPLTQYMVNSVFNARCVLDRLYQWLRPKVILEVRHD